ncbi:hypothetical protein ACLB2K_011371 [Fragaria x ananassa]
MMNAMLQSSGLPPNMWGDAILSANYLLNKVPKKKEEKTSYELWKGRKPSYDYLRVWGCLAKVAVPKPKKVKNGPKTVDCIFIEYADNNTAYRFLVHKSEISDIHKDTIMESRNASFYENVFPCKSREESSSSKQTREASTGTGQAANENSQHQEIEFEVEPRRSEPRTFKEAVNTIDSPLWKEAIKSEIDSILQNHTWELVRIFPPGCKPLSSKWIFKRKLKADGSIDKYKARLVLKGYKQREGLDYFNIYSLVTRITSIKIVLAIDALRNLEVYQMDVKTAFLNGDVEEEIYMEQPEGFSAPGQERKVCKLVKSLYSLKQALKQWHEKFDNAMITNGFKTQKVDMSSCVCMLMTCLSLEAMKR